MSSVIAPIAIGIASLSGMFGLVPETVAQAAIGLRQPDFNGDGFADLAVGVPGKNVDGQTNAGGVSVIYGSSHGLDASGDQFWTAGVANIPDGPQAGDELGASLAWGDFNDDGFTDLAIGIPFRKVNNILSAGAVLVLRGSADGLTVVGRQVWSQNASGVLDNAETGDQFGWSLVVGDFDGNGFDDLAIGSPGEDVGFNANAGTVHVIYGRLGGLASAHSQQWTQNSPFIDDASDAEDRFGWSLAAGDFNNDGRDDLAIGIPGEDVGFAVDAGAVEVIHGKLNGLNGSGDRFLTQDTTGILNQAETGDGFGSSVAAGDFDGDGFDDLAIGVPFEGQGSQTPDGAVHVLYGGSVGLKVFGDEFLGEKAFDPNPPPGTTLLGATLAVGDFDGDGISDLAIGAPLDHDGAGAVQVIYGRAGVGLDADLSERWTQDSSGIHGESEADDRFGAMLGAGDFDGNGADDLIVGVPLKEVGTAANAGAVNVIYGRSNGLSGVDDQVWTHESNGINSQSATNDHFGSRVDISLN